MLEPDLVIVSVLSLAVVIVFWGLQYRTRFFSIRYYLQVFSLFGIALLTLYPFLRLFALPMSMVNLLIGIYSAVVIVYHAGLAIIKLSQADLRYRWIHKANRAIVNYGTPHEKITLRTDDGERIQAIKLCNPYGEPNDPERAVIVCHGAGRSKNTLSVVQTCKVLATKYDVFTFDFRGHLESSGIFKADGDTEYDLKAMVDHIKQAGYKKIAVFGWSIGAWTALLSAARGRPIDAIIAAPPPPYDISKSFYVRSLAKLTVVSIPLLAGVSVVRGMWTGTGKHTIKLDDFIHKLPPIPLLLVYNDYDYVFRVSAEEFEKFSEKLPFGAEKMKLFGRGHIFDWPNTYLVWQKTFDWLAHSF